VIALISAVCIALAAAGGGAGALPGVAGIVLLTAAGVVLRVRGPF
jgi:hypothetical protein